MVVEEDSDFNVDGLEWRETETAVEYVNVVWVVEVNFRELEIIIVEEVAMKIVSSFLFCWKKF